ncbi:histidine phosphatase family protein [Arenimonas composti]|uniref:Phosphoglycerate mutase n=1 Tax=Arenimonas composti TR7-09 = DSM 18010 TaxID=1121013 RepID=A0A091B914_9GAMM|nr:histidine phosphatase family protein [Arenimonas composti]KFN48241.1 hypothetical protein P873_01405 [Arenimonas composti TR7-09 = DSM 18010]
MRKYLTAFLFAVLLPGAALAADPAPRTIVLVRHGQYIADPAIDEAIGPPLSPLGLAQARLAGDALAGLGGFDALYVSPMTRARDTAASIGTEIGRQDFAVIDDIAECTPPTRRSEITKDDAPEDLAACAARLDAVFARLFVPAEGRAARDMVVCHGNVIRYLVTRALGVDTQAWLEMSVRHASITVIRVEADGRFKVIAVGDAGHIPPGLHTGATGDPERTLSNNGVRDS